MPIYAHVKDIIDPQGNLEAIEVNYMTFLAYNGSYKVITPYYVWCDAHSDDIVPVHTYSVNTDACNCLVHATCLASGIKQSMVAFDSKTVTQCHLILGC